MMTIYGGSGKENGDSVKDRDNCEIRKARQKMRDVVMLAGSIGDCFVQSVQDCLLPFRCYKCLNGVYMYCILFDLGVGLFLLFVSA